MTEKVLLKIKLTIVEYRTEKHGNLYMTDLFTRCRDIANCIWWTKQSHLGICSKEKLLTSTLINNGILSSTANFAAGLSNVKMSIMLKMLIPELLAFLVMLLFFSLFCHSKFVYGGGVHFQKVARLFFRFFYSRYLHKINVKLTTITS